MKPRPADPGQRPMFDAFEMVRLEPAPAPAPGGPKPDARQLALAPARASVRRGSDAWYLRLTDPAEIEVMGTAWVPLPLTAAADFATVNAHCVRIGYAEAVDMTAWPYAGEVTP